MIASNEDLPRSDTPEKSAADAGPVEPAVAGSSAPSGHHSTSGEAPAGESTDPAESHQPGRDDVAVADRPPEETPHEDELPEYEPLTPELVEEEAIRGDFMIRWAVVLLAFLLGCTEIAETATLVHIKSGQYTLQNGLPARTGIFSSTAADQPWVNLSWLFDVMVAGIYAVAGAVGLSIFKALLAAVALWFVVQTTKPGVSTWWGSICAALALLVAFPWLTAQPEIATLVGLAATLWLLERWREEGATRHLILLVPVFIVWSNLDPRMFLGLAVLLLYALGDAAGAWLGLPTRLDAPRRKQLWMAFGACVLAAMVNPFGWQSLLAPGSLYGAEYPTWRQAHPVVRGLAELQFYPVTRPEFWEHVRESHHLVTGLLLLATAVVTFVLNFRRLDLGHVALFLGFAGFAVLASRELAAASLVAAVLATLNAQEWYRATFRQSYSVDLSELIFSRGGRAATVLGLVAIAYVAVSGRMGDPDGRRVGVGFHHAVGAGIEGMREDLAVLADLPDEGSFNVFNFVPSQGDLLIWLDKKAFIDSRMALYARGGDESLANLHDRTRLALAPRESRLSPAAAREWKRTLDEYQVTHAIPRLDVRLSSSSAPDRLTYVNLLLSRDWELLNVGATTAVFCRTDLNDERLAEHRRVHRTDYVEAAFRTKVDEVPPRTEFARPVSTYQKIVSLPATKVPNAVQQARNYLLTLEFLSPKRDPQAGTGQVDVARFRMDQAALAWLALRKASEGLSQQPQSASGYRRLADTYDVLSRIESRLMQEGLSTPRFAERLQSDPLARTVFEQAVRTSVLSLRTWRHQAAVHALRQALTIEPDHAPTCYKLARLHIEHQQIEDQFSGRASVPELALEPLSRYLELTAEDEDPATRDQLARRENDVRIEARLQEAVDSVAAQARTSLGEGADRLQVVQAVALEGCIQTALNLLEGDPEWLAENPVAQLLKIDLLLQAGRMEDAFHELQRQEGVARQYAPAQWRGWSAVVGLAQGEYAHAASMLIDSAGESENARVVSLLDSLPFTPVPVAAFQPAGAAVRASDFWPVQQASTVRQAALRTPNLIADVLLKAALTHLEAGNNSQAETQFRRILAVAPHSPLRPVVRFYLELVSGEPVSEFADSEGARVPSLDTLFPGPVAAPRP